MLDVVLGIGDQNLFDEIGMACEEHALRPDPEACKRAVLPGGLEQEVKQPGPEPAYAAADQRSRGAGRQIRANGFGSDQHWNRPLCLPIDGEPRVPGLGTAAFGVGSFYQGK